MGEGKWYKFPDHIEHIDGVAPIREDRLVYVIGNVNIKTVNRVQQTSFKGHKHRTEWKIAGVDIMKHLVEYPRRVV